MPRRSEGTSPTSSTTAAGSIPVDWEALARASTHPLRISILEVLAMDGGRTLSPRDLAKELQVPLSNVSYHVRVLRRPSGFIALARRRPIHGSVEHFYRLREISAGWPPIDWERLARANAHPARISILEILGIDGGRIMSPSDLSTELRIPVENTSHHVTELAKADLLVLSGTRKARGTTRHLYRLPEARDEAPRTAGT